MGHGRKAPAQVRLWGPDWQAANGRPTTEEMAAAKSWEGEPGEKEFTNREGAVVSGATETDAAERPSPLVSRAADEKMAVGWSSPGVSGRKADDHQYRPREHMCDGEIGSTVEQFVLYKPLQKETHALCLE